MLGISRVQPDRDNGCVFDYHKQCFALAMSASSAGSSAVQFVYNNVIVVFPFCSNISGSLSIMLLTDCQIAHEVLCLQKREG